MPATNYVWLYLLYDSSKQSESRQDRIHALAFALSDYFYEYVMIGTIDMAYPSNNRTFSHLLPNQNVAETPSLVVRYPETG